VTVVRGKGSPGSSGKKRGFRIEYLLGARGGKKRGSYAKEKKETLKGRASGESRKTHASAVIAGLNQERGLGCQKGKKGKGTKVDEGEKAR